MLKVFLSVVFYAFLLISLYFTPQEVDAQDSIACTADTQTGSIVTTVNGIPEDCPQNTCYKRRPTSGVSFTYDCYEIITSPAQPPPSNSSSPTQGSVSQPQLPTLSPSTLDKSSSGENNLNISVDLGQNKNDIYVLAVVQTSSQDRSGKTFNLLCPNNTCNLDSRTIGGNGVLPLRMTAVGTNGNIVSITLTGIQNMAPGSYSINIEPPPDQPQLFTAVGAPFVIQNNPTTQNVHPTIDPSYFARPEDTANANIRLTLLDGEKGKVYDIYFNTTGDSNLLPNLNNFLCSGPGCSLNFKLPATPLQPNTYRIIVVDRSNNNLGETTLTVGGNSAEFQKKPGDNNNTINTCVGPDCFSKSGGIPCDPKTGDEGGTGGIKSAIGCIPTEPQALIQGLLRVAIGAGGAIALLLMIGGAFQFITSAGSPDAVKGASDTFTSAIIGFLIIIFSVLLLQIIGVDILQIADFK